MTTPAPGSRATPDGIDVEVPAGWIEVDPPDGSSRRLAARSTRGGHIASVTISETAPTGSLSLWSDQTLLALRAMPSAQVLDHAGVVVGTTPSRRLLSHHVDAGGCVLETWIVPFPGRPLVLTCATSPVDYDALAPTFAAIAHSVTVAA